MRLNHWGKDWARCTKKRKKIGRPGKLANLFKWVSEVLRLGWMGKKEEGHLGLVGKKTPTMEAHKAKS